ncbi:hypothetical protein D3C77_805730 [compost metagenome]
MLLQKLSRLLPFATEQPMQLHPRQAHLKETTALLVVALALHSAKLEQLSTHAAEALR